MHSAWTLVALLPASSAPTVLGGKCNAPREAGENNNCLEGSYNDCVARNNQLNQQYCAGYCMKISNGDDCIESLKQMGDSGSDEQHKETCSQEGDSYYCNCDS
ncbi:hypothetical protein H9Q72_010331 [Fusarium xylarioides]|uniref:Uncharacterized protein n=1 Tax=Fusarium xylarioides TaxID=221167 RepID=A0A9P7HJ07_9HYPO|nr:hypothetical protein H9Q70_003768 [Fusarium xylarioides]KAG5761560.1 hypothetical protein H9Q72_010331 [Fusarium xylarioides]